MPLAGDARPAPGAVRQRTAPVCVLILLLLLGLAQPSSAASGCAADRIDDRARVSLAQDGDTLLLADGRRLRLIGINTPELGRDGRRPEPGALAARDRLRQILFASGQQVQLRFDRERHDRYGRLLAHAFLADGQNLTELLLSGGAGAQLVVPPNTWQADCYRAAADTARSARRGVWALPTHQPRPAESLDLRTEGFHVISGRVTHVSQSASAVWVNLAGDFALRIEREDLPQFQSIDLDGLAGSDIEAQGWIYARSGQLRMPLRHPAALRIVRPASPSGTRGPLQ